MLCLGHRGLVCSIDRCNNGARGGGSQPPSAELNAKFFVIVGWFFCHVLSQKCQFLGVCLPKAPEKLSLGGGVTRSPLFQPHPPPLVEASGASWSYCALGWGSEGLLPSDPLTSPCQPPAAVPLVPLIPRESMIAAAYTTCQGGPSVAEGGRQEAVGGGNAQRSEVGDSVRTMGR